MVIGYGYTVWIINWYLFHPRTVIQHSNAKLYFFQRNGKKVLHELNYCIAKSFLITVKNCDISYPTFARTQEKNKSEN